MTTQPPTNPLNARRDVVCKAIAEQIEAFAWDDDMKFAQKALPLLREIWDAAIAELARRAEGEFDEKAMREAQYIWAQHVHTTFHKDKPADEIQLRSLGRVPFEEGARWQWQRDQARIQHLENEYALLHAENDRLRAEVERLRGCLK